MKRTFLLITVLFLTLSVMGQDVDKTFDKVVLVKGGLQYADGTIQTTASTGVGTVTWTSITGKPSFATVATSGSYADLLNRPTLFDGTWASLSGKPTTFTPAAHNHASLYRPITYVPAWSEIINKPDTINLATVLPTITAIVIPNYTTAQINALTSQKEGSVVYDKTLHVMKYWNGTVWKIFVTGN